MNPVEKEEETVKIEEQKENAKIEEKEKETEIITCPIVTQMKKQLAHATDMVNELIAEDIYLDYYYESAKIKKIKNSKKKFINAFVEYYKARNKGLTERNEFIEKIMNTEDKCNELMEILNIEGTGSSGSGDIRQQEQEQQEQNLENNLTKKQEEIIEVIEKEIKNDEDLYVFFN
ncbi:hypothetical protein ABK040_000782 [Willaertia magna]